MDAIYAGTAKLVATKFGEMTKVSFNRTDLEKLTKYLNENDTEWVNLVIKEKKEKVEGKPTHYLQVDDWKPSATKEKKEFNPTVTKNEMVNKFEGDALPF
jgi:succinate dehydrogenase flavin-adding protein (antitoxin of CptAB toxin-antitoxin module)